MRINDNRGKSKELSFDELEPGKVYVSHKYQSYVLMSRHDWTIDLESGVAHSDDEHDGDVFTEVKAVLEVS